MKTVFSIVCSTILLLTPILDFDVIPKSIQFEVKNGRVSPKSALVIIQCPDDTPWKAEYPEGFGGEKEGIGAKNLIIHPLGDLSTASEESALKITSGNVTKSIEIMVNREKIINFDLRIFPERRVFHPGGSGEFVFLITCPDETACGQIKFTEPAEKPSGRVAVMPNYLTPPGIAKIAMSSSIHTKPNSFNLPVKANSKNRKFSGIIKSEVVELGDLPEKPIAEISTDNVSFIPGIDEAGKIITITPDSDTKNFRWEAVPDKPWIDFEPNHGYGNARIKVNLYKDGLTTDVDSGKIIFTFPGMETITREVVVDLLPNPTENFFVSPKTVFLGPLETLFSKPQIEIDVLTDTSWEIIEKPEWLNLSQENGVGKTIIDCDIIEDFESNERMVESEVVIRLSDYKESILSVKIMNLTTNKFLPEKVDCKKSGNVYKTDFFCATFDGNENLFFMQPNNGWLVRPNLSDYPKIGLSIYRLWGNDNTETLKVFRVIPGFNPELYLLDVSLID